MTSELFTAIEHVKQSHSTVSIVVFNKEGQWQYMDENFNSFHFGNEIDTSILESASDSIYDNFQLPFVYQL